MKKKWICTVCGYVHEGDEAPDFCPQCKQPKSKFKELVENSHLTYRIGLGFIINDTMEIDLKYSVPATGSFREDNYVPSWENSALTLGLSFILV